MSQAILAYVPVLHQGYLNFFRKYTEARILYLIDQTITTEERPLVKDIRCLPAADMKVAIEGLGIFDEVMVVGKSELERLANSDLALILPDEELMHVLAETYFSVSKITFDTTFLRWDRSSILANKEVTSAQSISPDTFEIAFLSKATELKEKSADWWRQVGAAVAKDGQLLLSAWNHHLPSELEPYFNGDPRATFHKGEYIELSTAIHAESAIVAEAAQKGIALAGSELYVTTFPYPVCAKLVAEAGIKTIYFSEGYAMLDGETVLQAKGIEIFKVS